MSKPETGLVRRCLALLAAGLVAVAVCAEQPARSAPDDSEARALELFEEGKKAYREGKFDESVNYLEEAYSLFKEPVLLYNLARAEEGRGKFKQAVTAYEEYLRTAKEIPDRGAIETKVGNLKKTVAEQEQLLRERDSALAKKPEVTPAPVAEPDAGSPWPWLLAGLGAGGLVAGAVTGGLALVENADADAAASQAETVELRDGAETLAITSTVLFAASGVVLAGGMIWGIVDVVSLDDGSPQAARLRIKLAPTSFAVEFTH